MFYTRCYVALIIMAKFKIKAIEHYSKEYTIEANTLEEAIDKIATQYEDEEIDLIGDETYYNGMDFIENTMKGYNYYLNCVCELKERD